VTAAAPTPNLTPLDLELQNCDPVNLLPQPALQYTTKAEVLKIVPRKNTAPTYRTHSSIIDFMITKQTIMMHSVPLA
jgi:hypothetical protein